MMPPRPETDVPGAPPHAPRHSPALAVTRLRGSGVAAIAVLWTTVAVGMVLTGLGFFDRRPISYLGTDHRTVLLFRAGLVAGAALLAAFAFYVRGVLAASKTFLAASLIGLAGQVVAAAVPITGPGRDHAIHTVGGLILGASLPVLMWRFAAGRTAGPARRIAYRLFWLEAAACVVGVLLSRWGKAPIAEILPAGAFHLWIAVVSSGRFAPLAGDGPGR